MQLEVGLRARLHHAPPVHTFTHQEKKLAAKEKLSQMEAELVAASEELKSQKEEEKAKRIKSIK